MRESDFEAFGALLDGACGLLSRGKYAPSATNTALFFRALARHPIEVVRQAFDAHIADTKRGQFVPNPADILAQIEGQAADDGRPGAEEAWAMAMRANDEAETIVWTEEMAQAYAICKPLMDEGDQIGARMAFKESYLRQVEDARRIRRPVVWSASLGHDVEKRHVALVKAETLGLIGAGEALRLAPPQAEGDQFALLLEASAVRPGPEGVRQRVAALKAKMQAPTAISAISVAELGQIITAAKKAQIAEQVQAYTQETTQ